MASLADQSAADSLTATSTVSRVTLRIATGVRWMEVDDGAVIFEPAGPRFVDLNDLATALWVLLLEADVDVAVMSAWIVNESGLAPEEAERTMLEFVGNLTMSGVLVDDSVTPDEAGLRNDLPGTRTND